MIRLRTPTAERVLQDPRISRAQRLAIERVMREDSDAGLEGLDERMRPVIVAKLGSPRRNRRYALLRNGDPARAGKMLETWTP